MCRELRFERLPNGAKGRMRDYEWANCSITWIKDSQGNVKRWMQLKIQPSWDEKNIICKYMLHGDEILLYQAEYSRADRYPCRFFTLICFDWIAVNGGRSLHEQLLMELAHRWAGNPKNVDWAFVLQHNAHPNDNQFLTNTQCFLDTSLYSVVDRSNAGVVMANTAAKESPGRGTEGGFCSCIFSPNSPFDTRVYSYPSVCFFTERLRGSTILQRCKDSVFREMGACIHRIRVKVPRFVSWGVAGRSVPIEEAVVYGIVESTDTRIPGAPVSALVKWIRDELDELDSLADRYFVGQPLEQTIRDNQNMVMEGYKTISFDQLLSHMKLGTVEWSEYHDNRNPCMDIDLWNTQERNSLTHQIHALSVMGVVGELQVVDSQFHANIYIDGSLFSIAAIRAHTYDKGRKHFDESTGGLRTNNATILIIADDAGLPPVDREMQTIFGSASDSGLKPVAWADLLQKCRNAAVEKDFREAANGLFTVCEPKII